MEKALSESNIRDHNNRLGPYKDFYLLRVITIYLYVAISAIYYYCILKESYVWSSSILILSMMYILVIHVYFYCKMRVIMKTIRIDNTYIQFAFWLLILGQLGLAIVILAESISGNSSCDWLYFSLCVTTACLVILLFIVTILILKVRRPVSAYESDPQF
jgi:hypothetical protein